MTYNLVYLGGLDLWKDLIQRPLFWHIKQPVCHIQSKFGLDAIQQGFRYERKG